MYKEIAIKVGEKFNSFVKCGRHSKDLLGKEKAGDLSFFSPEIALKISAEQIETKNCIYKSRMFRFEKVG